MSFNVAFLMFPYDKIQTIYFLKSHTIAALCSSPWCEYFFDLCQYCRCSHWSVKLISAGFHLCNVTFSLNISLVLFGEVIWKTFFRFFQKSQQYFSYRQRKSTTHYCGQLSCFLSLLWSLTILEPSFAFYDTSIFESICRLFCKHSLILELYAVST